MKASASLEGGSFGTFNQTAKISGSADWLSYFFGFGHFQSEATSVTPEISFRWTHNQPERL